MHFYLSAPVNTRVHGKVLSLSYHAVVIFEQLLLFFKAHFPTVFHEITGITDALKKNAHDQNEQTIIAYSLHRLGANAKRLY